MPLHSVLGLIALAAGLTGQTQGVIPTAPPGGAAARSRIPSQDDERPLLFEDKQRLMERLKLQFEMRRADALRSPNRRIVCGLTVITADPAVDPKMILEFRDSSDAKIRRIEPPVCSE